MAKSFLNWLFLYNGTTTIVDYYTNGGNAERISFRLSFSLLPIASGFKNLITFFIRYVIFFKFPLFSCPEKAFNSLFYGLIICYLSLI